MKRNRSPAEVSEACYAHDGTTKLENANFPDKTRNVDLPIATADERGEAKVGNVELSNDEASNASEAKVIVFRSGRNWPHRLYLACE